MQTITWMGKWILSQFRLHTSQAVYQLLTPEAVRCVVLRGQVCGTCYTAIKNEYYCYDVSAHLYHLTVHFPFVPPVLCFLHLPPFRSNTILYSILSSFLAYCYKSLSAQSFILGSALQFITTSLSRPTFKSSCTASSLYGKLTKVYFHFPHPTSLLLFSFTSSSHVISCTLFFFTQ